MTTKVNDTSVETEKKPEGDAPADTKPEEGKDEGEKTVGEIIEAKKPSEKKEPETVGLDKFLEEKKARKAAEKKLKELESRLDDGEKLDADTISDEIVAIGEEFEVDPKFLSKLTKALTKKAAAEADAKVTDRLKPLEEKDREERLDKTFKTHFDAALEKFPPELAKIVKPDVIKTLSLDPRNSKKTFSDLIEETYGHVVPGKRSIEKTTPGGGKEPEPIDFDKARRDPAYFREIMADPKRKKAYNEGIEHRIGL